MPTTSKLLLLLTTFKSTFSYCRLKIEVTPENAPFIAKTVANLTSNVGKINSRGIQAASNILEKLAKVDYTSPEVSALILKIKMQEPKFKTKEAKDQLKNSR